MFYLKNDDMEELFRKAAENYDVDTSKASDWESVYNALHSQSPEEDKNKKEKKKKRRFFFWWLLLFPAGWMAHNTWVKMGDRPVKKVTTVEQHQPATVGNTNPGLLKKEEITTAEEITTGNTKMQTFQKGIPDKMQQEPQSVSSVNHNDKLNNKKKLLTKSQLQLGNENTGHNANKNIHKGNGNMLQRQDTSFERDSERDGIEKEILPEWQRVELDRRYKLSTVNLQLPVIAQYTLAGESNMDTSKKKEKADIKRNIHYFYLTALAAPDLSTVKFQKFSGTGSSFGLLTGYRINKRWHVETGAFLEKKLYYTSAKYFDKSKLSPYLQNVKMLYVDGNCKMITVPLNIRYNVFAGERSNWFVAGGMSSYFMSREYYDYTYQYYSEPPRTKGYDYKVSEQNWMTVININIGYERSVWKKYNFRVEPYFRLPVAGVGTGNLSLSSGGIYVGFGRRF